MRTNLFEQNLTEFYTDASYTLKESELEGKKFRVLEGTAAKGGIVNRNKRRYRTSIFENTISTYVRDKLAANKYLGELEHPSEIRSRLSRAAVKFTDVWMEGDLLKYRGIILNTPSGNILESLLEAGVTVGVSTRGAGSYKYETVNGEDIEEIQDDYVMTGIDFVLDESNPYGGVSKFESQKGGHTMEIKTVEQLTAHFPELTKQVESAAYAKGAEEKEVSLTESHQTQVEDAKEQAIKEYKESEEGKKYETAFNAMVEAMKPHLPETVRMAESELGQQVTSLTESTQTLETEKRDLEKKLRQAEAKLENLENQEKVHALVESKVSGHKFEKALRERLMEAKSEEDVEAMFTKETAFLESINYSPEQVPAGTGKLDEEQKDPKETEPEATKTIASRLSRLAGLN